MKIRLGSFFFRTERKMFHKTELSFHHMVFTDGIGLSILFLREDLVGKKLSKELYIDELEDYSSLRR